MERLREIQKRLADFREVGLALILFYVLNLALFAAIRTRPDLLEYLSLSPQRPWGIVTSVFVHQEFFGHLFGNLLFFGFYCVAFVVTNWPCDAETRRFSSKLFLWLVFLSGFLANTIVFFRWPGGKQAFGASGVVYAAVGAWLASLPFGLASLPGYWKETGSMGKLIPVVIALLAAAITGSLISDPRGFLNAAPEVNVYAHAWGFSIGLILFIVVFLVRSLRIMKFWGKLRREGLWTWQRQFSAFT